MIGVYLGGVHWLRVRRSLKKVISPFRSWMKWHHILGLVTGLFVVSWIVSGWLSMDHGRLFSTANPSLQQVSAVSGGSFGEVTSRANIADLRERTAAVEFSFHAFGGAAIVVSKNQQGAISAPMLEPGLVANVVFELSLKFL